MKTNALLILSLSLLLISSTSCQKEPDNLLEIQNQLIGSWSAYDYKFESEEWTDNPGDDSPYIILAEYGSGFDLTKSEYFTHYSNSFPTGGALRGTWKVTDASTLEFTSYSKFVANPIFEVKILEFENDFLRILKADVEYKLRRIE